MRPTAEQIRVVAQALCRAQNDAKCVMDEHPERGQCTAKNCRMIDVAKRAITVARID